MTCEKSTKLIEESSRNFLAALNKPLIEDIIKEIIASDREITNILDVKNHDREAIKSDPETSHKYLLEHTKLNRNKRNNRLDKLQSYYWYMGLQFPDHLSNNMDDKEKKYIEDYHSLVDKFSKNFFTKNPELIKHLIPPSDLNVEVLATADFELKTDNGVRKFEKNMTYTVLMSEADLLFRKGLLLINE